MTTTEVAALAEGLSKAQRELLIDAVRLLDWMAGEGRGIARGQGEFLFADEVLYDLANAFMPTWDGEGDYADAFRNHFLASGGA